MSRRRKVKDPKRFKVLTKRCDQCPFSQNQTIIPTERLEEIKKDLRETNNPFVCHKTMNTKQGDLVCRGYYDVVPGLVVNLVHMLGVVEFIEFDPDKKEVRK